MEMHARICRTVREDVSATADDEATVLPAAEVTRHLDDCAECRRYAQAVGVLDRRVRIGVAEQVPDLTAAVLISLADDRAATQDRRTRDLRGLVALAGLVQLALAMPGLVGLVGPDLHLGRDLAALQLALGVGFLVAAWQPSRAAGLLPVAGVVALAALATGMVDVATGAATLAGELTHLTELVGVAALYGLRRRVPSGPLPLRAGAEPI